MKTGVGTDLPPLFGAEMHEDPYPVYRRLRESDPIHWNDALQGWVLTRYDDVAWALKSLSSDRVTTARERFRDAGLDPLWDALAALMIQRDEPDHTRLRALVQKAFHRSSVEQWRGSIERRVRALLTPALERGEMDFIWDFAVPLPILVISELVGVPEDDREQVKRWCDDFSIVAVNFYATISTDQLARGLQSVKEFRAYLEAQVETLDRAPRQDLLSSLVLAEHEGHRLTIDELLANAILLLNAGNETTSSLLSNGLFALLQHPEQLARLRAEPGLMSDAVEECLRFDSPVQFQGRVASRTPSAPACRFAAVSSSSPSSARPTATPRISRSPIASTCPDIRTSTWPSAMATITVSAQSWPGSRGTSRSGSCSRS